MKACFPECLGDPACNGVHDVTGAVPAQVPVLDARALPGRDAWLLALGQVLGFPDYYGANWDALEECLMDLSWHEGPLLLHITHADTLEGADQRMLVDLFTEAATYWKQAGRVCVLFLSR